MKRRFKSRQFQEGVLIDVRLADRQDPACIGLISGILKFVMDNNLYNIGGGSTTGGGMYVAFHTKEDALKIKKFIKEYLKYENSV